MIKHSIKIILALICSMPLYSLEVTIPAVWGSDSWNQSAYTAGVKEKTWKGAKQALVLEEGAYRPESSTDLLMHFDGVPFSDAGGRYRISSSSAGFTDKAGMLGSGCAVFQHSEGGIIIEPGPAAMFFPGSIAGNNPGSFSIEFWLNPATLGQGETIFSWEGGIRLNNKFYSQEISCSISNQRLVWHFENIFFSALQEPLDITLQGKDILVPKQWVHHILRFDNKTGLLEYAKQNIPEAVTYTNRTGRQSAEIFSPRLGSISQGSLELGGNFIGFIDEFRISKAYISNPQLTRYLPGSGIYISPPLDLGITRSRIFSISSIQSTPGETDIAYYYHLSDSYDMLNSADGAWTPFVPGESFGDSARGRYLQLLIQLFPDGRLQESPVAASVTVTYEKDDPPSPPAGVTAQALDGRVSLSWKASTEPDVLGYKVYYGTSPGRYFGLDSSLGPSPLDVPGPAADKDNRISLEIRGLQNGQIYYFAVTAYDFQETAHQSAFSREVNARPKKTGSGQ